MSFESSLRRHPGPLALCSSHHHPERCLQADAASQNFEHAFGNHKIQQENERAATAWGRDPNHGEHKPKTHVVLTTHPRRGLNVPVVWGAKDPKERGPVIATVTSARYRNAIGTHNGSYSIVSMDPWGHKIVDAFGDNLRDGLDVRPTIGVTKAHIQAAIEHVWHLPGVAARFNISEASLRRNMFEQTGGMFPELITRSDINVFLPPIGGQTVYIFGPPEYLRDESKICTVRVHDECNGSDVFGSDICTCRPYLVHGIEECVRTAQEGGVGVIVYFRKEGRSLGEVTKFLVYNARKRQEGGDRAETYFHRTACVAGVEDMRFQELMPDALHWLGIKKIDKLVSMSDMKYNAITGSGIKVLERVAIPDDLIPADAHVEIDAKMYAGYFVPEEKRALVNDDLLKTEGRGLDE
ncbi:hypothetical protein T484DRAFT_1933926 [Baffinella frigidus]|nr:hypothetical protein T484DRAFT_1933926 [Cryptophyta sp. CCMP2293]